MSEFIKEHLEETDFTFKEAVNEAKRCLNCLKPKCRMGCPIENDIPEFISALATGNIGLAAQVIARKSNLPAVCGRVCPREKQCEGACILNAKSAPIKIGQLERFIADMDGALELSKVPLPGNKGKIAVIGSGPAGLTVAGDLAKLGFKVTVFDAQAEPGGVLTYGIPEFRLSKEIVRREIHKIERLGVTFENNVIIGETLILEDLFADNYDAAFIGTGNSVAKTLDVLGKDLNGVLEAMYFLQMVTLFNQGSIDKEEIPVKPGDKVFVIGAGNVAMDAARTALREGAESVTVVFRSKETTALESETLAAEAEGVRFLSLHTPKQFLGKDKLEAVEFIQRRIIDNEEIVDTDEIKTYPCNKIILAIGQKPAARIVTTSKGIEVESGGFVKISNRPYGMTTRRGVFAGGDVVHGPATVVRAMKDAKKVALGIAQYVEAKKLLEECGLSITD